MKKSTINRNCTNETHFTTANEWTTPVIDGYGK